MNNIRTGGTLTVSDGTNTAEIGVVGQYSAAGAQANAEGAGTVLAYDAPAANHAMRGGAADDILICGGNDILVGGAGNDVLSGGIGSDKLTGGTGADTFVFRETGSANMDHIVDYNAAEGDKIDLQALLDTNFDSGSNINDFVKLTQAGNNITVSVDTDGTTGGANFSDVCILENYGTPGNDLTVLSEFPC